MFKLETPSETTKLLVPINNENFLRYYFGYYGINIAKVEKIVTMGPPSNRPTLITINYYVDDKELNDVLEEISKLDFPVKRVFKSAFVDEKKGSSCFIKACAVNLVNICKGRLIKVECKNNKDLQARFYKAIVEANKEYKTGCKFDYDTWEVKFVIREYSANGKRVIVTYAEGLDCLDE